MIGELTPIEISILVGLVSIMDDLAERPVPSGYGVGMDRRRVLDAREGLVECRSIQCHASNRMQTSRAYGDLDRRGLIERVALGRGAATTHLRLTAAGRALAEQLQQEATDG